MVTSPAGNPSIAFGGCTAVNIAFTATDAESVITAVSADVNGKMVNLTTIEGLGTNSVNASGTYTPGSDDPIGTYTVTAHATSAGGTGDGTATFNVNYIISFLPPLSLGKTNKGGSTVPIKFTARDCNGGFVHDESVKVVVQEITNGVDVEQLSGVFGEGASFVRIDDEVSQYIINFQTSSGAHNYRVDVFFNDFTDTPFKQEGKTFSVR